MSEPVNLVEAVQAAIEEETKRAAERMATLARMLEDAKARDGGGFAEVSEKPTAEIEYPPEPEPEPAPKPRAKVSSARKERGSAVRRADARSGRGSAMEGKVQSALIKKGEMTAAEIADFLGVTVPPVRLAVKRLLKAKKVREVGVRPRPKGEKQGRGSMVYATVHREAEGKAARSAHKTPASARFHQAIEWTRSLIAEHPGISMKRLCRELDLKGVKEHTARQSVDVLIRRGLVRRLRDGRKITYAPAPSPEDAAANGERKMDLNERKPKQDTVLIAHAHTVLAEIKRSGRLTVNGVAVKTGLTTAQVNSVIDWLGKEEVVRRINQPGGIPLYEAVSGAKITPLRVRGGHPEGVVS